jgi:hypothetical protein
MLAAAALAAPSLAAATQDDNHKVQLTAMRATQDDSHKVELTATSLPVQSPPAASNGLAIPLEPPPTHAREGGGGVGIGAPAKTAKNASTAKALQRSLQAAKRVHERELEQLRQAAQLQSTHLGLLHDTFASRIPQDYTAVGASSPTM